MTGFDWQLMANKPGIVLTTIQNVSLSYNNGTGGKCIHRDQVGGDLISEGNLAQPMFEYPNSVAVTPTPEPTPTLEPTPTSMPPTSTPTPTPTPTMGGNPGDQGDKTSLDFLYARINAKLSHCLACVFLNTQLKCVGLCFAAPHN